MSSNKKYTFQNIFKYISEFLQNKNTHLAITDNYKRLFDNATISIWDEDFTLLFKQLNELKKLDISNIKTHLEQNPKLLFSLLEKIKVNSVNTTTLKLFKAENKAEFLKNIQSTFGEGADKVFVNFIVSIWNNEKSFTSEVNYKTLKGDEFPALFSVHIPQTKEEQQSVPITIQNIQKLKDAEAAKKDSFLKLEQAQKLGQIGNWEWNPKTDNSVWSDEMYRIYGVEKDDFIPNTENVLKTILEEDKHKMEYAISKVLKGEKIDSFEFKIIRPNKQIRNLNIIALQINEDIIYGITQDITDIKKIEKQLNETQKLAQVGSWLFDLSTQKIEWSEETFRLWGFDLKEGAPDYNTLLSKIHKDDHELFNNSVDKAIKLGIPYDIEHRIIFSDGEEKVIRAICKPVFGSNNEVISLAGTSQDITSHKLFELEQVKYQRLKAIGEMSSSVAHDFNNSLQQMVGNLEIIKLQKDLSNNTIERLNTIEAIIGDVADRVSALQKFGDAEHNNLDATLLDFNILIEDVLKQSRPLWKDTLEKKGVKINVITNLKDVPEISCNSGELKSVIYNLVKNSVEAMPKGGDLVIKTDSNTKHVTVTFTDTGKGMDNKTKLKIFEPFFTTKGYKLGRGLGMSGAYNTIKKYKGNIIVKKSELGKGTTIEISLPISQVLKIDEKTKKITENKKSLRILWVDDDILITEVAQILVEEIGHECTIANSGKEALEFLNNNTYDIVFTDIGMPEMNGWELADIIKNKFEDNLKIIAVTGWDIKLKNKAKNSFDFVMQKPFDLENLKKIFKEITALY